MTEAYQLIDRKPSTHELFTLRKSVGWGIGEFETFEKGLQNSLFGFWARPTERFGAGMMQFWKK